MIDLSNVSADQIKAVMDRLAAERRTAVQRATGVDLSKCKTMKEEIDALAADPAIQRAFKEACK